MKLTVERGLPARQGKTMTRIFHKGHQGHKDQIRLLFVSSGDQAAPAFAQMTGAPTSGYKREPGMTASTIPAPLREIGFDQNLDQLVPLDTTLVDEAGRTVRLGDYFGKRPVVLVFAYYDCPMLCTQVINGLASALGVLSLGATRRQRPPQRRPCI
jgi:hypothetical protein